LIAVAVTSGARLAGADREAVQRLGDYGNKVGLAYQIVDDILDVEGTVEQLGKDVGSDAVRGKGTYPGLYGLQESKLMAETLVRDAKNALRPWGTRTAVLNAFADYVLSRQN
ncbi:MAG: polyprenyl synthetase family protein, partial [Chitinivibrionales bacterium]|nr:polyprenyl synthetase family protein [Chitinivibrionales bacterium]